MSRRSDSIKVTRSRNPSMRSVLLRQRTDPNTSAPRSRAYSARWLPTKPVIPVIKIRIPAIVLHPLRRTFYTPWPAKRAPPGDREGERRDGPQREDDAPPGVGVAPHGSPPHPGLGEESVVVANRGDASGREPADHEELGQVGHARDASHPHPEVVVLGDWKRRIVPTRTVEHAAPHHDRGVHHRVLADERPANRGIVNGRAQDGDFATARIELASPRPQQSHVRMRVEVLPL